MKNLSPKTIIPIFIALAILLTPPTVHSAGSKYLFKIASLAPAGSVWANHFDNFSREITEKSNGEITFKVYPGGVMGDDRAMYRKMQIGQLHGGGFTMTGISEIIPDFRVLGIPVLFDSLQEVDKVTEALLPSFKKAFAEKNLSLVAMTEVGFVYTMSTVPIKDLDLLRKSKCWLPPNDPINQAFFEDIGISPIQLSIPDVLSSLQTGLIDTVFNSFYGAIVLQWFTKTSYITDAPFGYAYGALVFSKKAMDRLPPEYVAMIDELAEKHFSKLLADTRRSNEEALAALKQNGIKIIEPTPEALRQLKMHREKTVKKTIGKAFSKEIHAETMQVLSEIRRLAKVSGH
ncbi:MAG: TRAP transporter substrate-binding protein DctP [Desulfurivibrionaceae bacterium]|nr:TRAP transporter substrate-binding protein DctP [Desulfobulbales bacterium]MDT8334499.1 TRAP transporter substrate-binding protein DctP [Desulfurivibrionaceae bacterium]